MGSATSKLLGGSDSSGVEFVQELLAGDPTYAINFDRLQYDRGRNQYVIFEFLLCEESQLVVTPHTSHPRRYWYKNKQKFISLWEATKKLEARLFLVNYAKKGTKHEDKVLVIEVERMDDEGITQEKVYKLTRAQFAEWFRKMNARCAAPRTTDSVPPPPAPCVPGIPSAA